MLKKMNLVVILFCAVLLVFGIYLGVNIFTITSLIGVILILSYLKIRNKVE